MRELYKWVKENKDNLFVDTWVIIGDFEYNLFYDKNDLIISKYDIIPDCPDPFEYFIKSKVIFTYKVDA
jgi:hypothetical protein